MSCWRCAGRSTGRHRTARAWRSMSRRRATCTARCSHQSRPGCATAAGTGTTPGRRGSRAVWRCSSRGSVPSRWDACWVSRAPRPSACSAWRANGGWCSRRKGRSRARVDTGFAPLAPRLPPVMGGGEDRKMPPRRTFGRRPAATPFKNGDNGRNGDERRRRLPGLRLVQGHGGADQLLERGLVELVVLVDVDGATYVAVETRVEQLRRIVERGALGEGQLHDRLVRFAGADDAVVLPHRHAAPLPCLDHL